VTAVKKRSWVQATCGTCMGAIDLERVRKALRENTELAHECGRTLVRGRGNAEVPTDNTADPDSSNFSTSEPAGDT
jgi:hypothetical protein